MSLLVRIATRVGNMKNPALPYEHDTIIFIDISEFIHLLPLSDESRRYLNSIPPVEARVRGNQGLDYSPTA